MRDVGTAPTPAKFSWLLRGAILVGALAGVAGFAATIAQGNSQSSLTREGVDRNFRASECVVRLIRLPEAERASLTDDEVLRRCPVLQDRP
jgi:hypothetical protein